MGAIRILAPSVRDQIAAGEVVERPVSVVKELIENSLDAGAGRIAVRVEGGGKTEICVRDDGRGMDQADLVLSIQRHATSKLETMEDLAQANWLGFRGEALAAIAAVSRITVTTRPIDAPTGLRLYQAGTAPPRIESVPAAQGTTVTVEDLFYTVPARLHHLKSDGAELAPIQQLVTALALAYPDIGFHLETGGRVLFDTSGNASVSAVTLAAFGREAAEASLPLDFANVDGTVRIGGLVVSPAISRATRQAEIVTINGRLVQNWALRSALEEAYRPELPERRFPVACLQIVIDPLRLDPNVHPQKLTVRIDGERKVAALVYRAVRDRLAGASSMPYWPSASGQAKSADDASVRQETVWAASPDQLEMPTRAEESGEANAREPSPLAAELGQMRALGQWRHKYIVAEGPLGLYLIDQHAAHERIYFERFREEFARSTHSQWLVQGIGVNLPSLVVSELETRRAELEGLGFDWSAVGEDTLVVRAVPEALSEPSPGSELLARIFEGFCENSPENPHPWARWKEAAAAMAACRTAIKAYRPLADEEITGLIAQLAACRDPRSCPHGRPTLLHFGLEEVDRRFGRKG